MSLGWRELVRVLKEVLGFGGALVIFCVGGGAGLDSHLLSSSAGPVHRTREMQPAGWP
jgi:hypothetical protein